MVTLHLVGGCHAKGHTRDARGVRTWCALCGAITIFETCLAPKAPCWASFWFAGTGCAPLAFGTDLTVALRGEVGHGRIATSGACKCCWRAERTLCRASRKGVSSTWGRLTTSADSSIKRRSHIMPFLARRWFCCCPRAQSTSRAIRRRRKSKRVEGCITGPATKKESRRRGCGFE